MIFWFRRDKSNWIIEPVKPMIFVNEYQKLFALNPLLMRITITINQGWFQTLNGKEG